ncbi:MAG TPA: hypothetical protein VJX67_10255, partial [Blastocatellia bacterium]|nr:hypothetical protein [Blastocatellia bacterium]
MAAIKRILLSRFWQRSIVVLACVLVAWSVLLAVVAQQRQQELSANLGLASKLNGLDRALRLLDEWGQSNGPDNPAGEWAASYSAYEGARREIPTEMVTARLRSALEGIDPLLTKIARAHSSGVAGSGESIDVRQTDTDLRSQLSVLARTAIEASQSQQSTL